MSRFPLEAASVPRFEAPSIVSRRTLHAFYPWDRHVLVQHTAPSCLQKRASKSNVVPGGNSQNVVIE